jgi:hypothetical protein
MADAGDTSVPGLVPPTGLSPPNGFSIGLRRWLIA